MSDFYATMLQRVGAAILEADTKWRPTDDVSRERALAIAALEAMREPSPGMMRPTVFSHFISLDDGADEDNAYVSENVMRNVWQAMIDEALQK